MFSFVFRPRKQNSAETAKERLQILLAHERLDGGSSPDYLPLLQKEILEVVRRHIQLDKEAVDVRLERGKDMSSLEINIELPGAPKLGVRGAAPTAPAVPAAAPEETPAAEAAEIAPKAD